MADHLVYGKAADTGTPIHFTDENGVKRAAHIKRLEPVYHADIEADIDGVRRFFGHVPFNDGGVPGTWGHVEEDAPKTEQSADSTNIASTPDAESKKRGK